MPLLVIISRAPTLAVVRLHAAERACALTCGFHPLAPSVRFCLGSTTPNDDAAPFLLLALLLPVVIFGIWREAPGSSRDTELNKHTLSPSQSHRAHCCGARRLSSAVPRNDDILHQLDEGIARDDEQQQPKVPPEDDGAVHEANRVDDIEAVLAHPANRKVGACVDDISLLIVGRARRDGYEPAIFVAGKLSRACPAFRCRRALCVPRQHSLESGQLSSERRHEGEQCQCSALVLEGTKAKD